MRWIDQTEIEALLDYPSLIESLRAAFRKDILVPTRTHLDYANPPHKRSSTLLTMPAYEAGKDLGIKIATVSPENAQFGKPSIHALYLHFDAATGEPKAVMDARIITARRTAAASALAASYLAKPFAKTMIMLGTGALAPELIAAHLEVSPLEKVWLWGRNFAKAEQLAAQLSSKLPVEIQPIRVIDAFIEEADIISAATLSPDPLIKGALLNEGQHLDLVGAYRPDMRESDDDCVRNAQLYVDVMPNPLKEAGDLAIPLANGVISEKDIIGDLYDLCRGKERGRVSLDEITYFKSVGYALEDLAAAQLIMKRIK